MFKMFDFSFETCIKISSSLINRSINEALLVADHFDQMPFQLIDVYNNTSLFSDKHVPVGFSR